MTGSWRGTASRQRTLLSEKSGSIVIVEGSMIDVVRGIFYGALLLESSSRVVSLLIGGRSLRIGA